MIKRVVQAILFVGGLGFLLSSFPFQAAAPSMATILTVRAVRQDLNVEIKTIGELEAARSVVVASAIKGDQGKIIDLIADGVYVQPGDRLARLDPTAFEDKIEKLSAQLRQQERELVNLEQALEWEINKADHENRTAAYEVEAAELELDKILYGDGPQEESRLKSEMQKARLKWDELSGYSQDLIELEAEGFLNPAEVKQAQKQMVEAQEAYDRAERQYENYVRHVLPMQVKKGETQLKRAELKQEETEKLGCYNIAKAAAACEQTQQLLEDTSVQFREAQNELAQTEIVAPSSGMVVLRDDYRSGQRRKPRVGDVLFKNQPVLDLPDLSSMVVKTRVREVDLFKISVGQKASIAVDAYPELSFEGTIASIGVLALSDLERPNEEKYFEMRLTLDKTDPCLRPGMTTRVVIHAQERRKVLTLPIHTVFYEGRQSYCYVRVNDHYEKRAVRLGMENEHWVEVLDGLEEGVTVSVFKMPYI